VKDIIDTHDMPTRYGSPIHAGHRPSADAACVALAREAGAVMLGKTVTTEFALRHPGPTANPHNPAHTPGGSSSGSAAAVATSWCRSPSAPRPGGSIIRPASYCGVIGYKPSFRHDQPDRREAARRKLRHRRPLCPLRRRLRAGRRRACG
jgi:amidase